VYQIKNKDIDLFVSTMKIIIGILANAFAILLTHVKSQNNEVCFDAPAFISSIIETGDCYCAGGCDWFAGM